MRAYLFLILLAGCRIDDRRYSSAADAGPTTFHVGGTVTGMWDGVDATLRLEAPGIDEALVVDGTGGFTFEAELEPQTEFTVTIDAQPDAHVCTVTPDGTVTDEDFEDLVLDCDGPDVDIAFTAPIDLDFDVDTIAYDLDVSTLIRETAVVVVAPEATTIRLGGSDLLSAAPSAPVGMSAGANVFDIDVEVGDAHRSFAIEINRGGVLIEQYLYAKGANTGAFDSFGVAMALSGDTLAVGADTEDSSATSINGPDNDLADAAGAVYVLRRHGSVWHQEAYIKASNARANSAFGYSLALQGNLLVVGAPFEDGPTGAETDSGAVYIFEREGQTWSERAVLRSPTQFVSLFGWSVAVDGDVVVVGTPDGGQSGRAVFFRRAGSQWDVEDEVRLPGPGTTIDEFGYSVAISGDRAVVGAPGFSAARAHVFERSGSDWIQGQTLLETPISPSSKFGEGVDILGDTIVVGATSDPCDCRGVNPVADNSDDPGAGAVHVFRFDGNNWVREAFIKSSNSDAGDQFGWSLDLAVDRLIIGATGEAGNGTGSAADPDDNSAPGAGAAYVFSRSGTIWVEDAYLKASNTEGGDGAGHSVAISSDAAAFGARAEDSAAQGLDGSQVDNSALVAGAVYVFR